MFYVSTLVDFGTSVVSPPIRAQITHCVEPKELGKIFAMLASIESLIPIIGTNMYTRIYNSTRELAYPLPGMIGNSNTLNLDKGLSILVKLTLYTWSSLVGKKIVDLET